LAVARVIKLVSSKKASPDTNVGTWLTRRLQQFHTTLGLLWSLAASAAGPHEFDLTVTSLEMLLAAELLSNSRGITLPPAFAEDVLAFLLSMALPFEGQLQDVLPREVIALDQDEELLASQAPDDGVEGAAEENSGSETEWNPPASAFGPVATQEDSDTDS
jgi:hypothetical protein